MLNKSLVLAFDLKWYFANIGCKILEGTLAYVDFANIYIVMIYRDEVLCGLRTWDTAHGGSLENHL